ncbi:uncharacterized protein LOC144446976 isoform X3 [Glandiceps talaboti]
MTKRVDNSTSESRLMATSPDFQIQSLKKANDEMRKHIARLKSDMEQERNKFKKLKRERVKDIRTAREQQQQQAIMAISDLKQKLHQEKSNELLAQKDTLTRQFEIEVKKLVRQKDDALGKMQSELHKTKEEFLMKTRNRVAADAQDEARKKFEMERNRLLQEISDLRDGKKKVEIMLSDISEADRRRAAEMKWKYEKHQMEVEQLKKDARRDICRLVEELKKKNRVISELDKELGYQCGHSQKLKAEKDSLKGELQNLVKMAETWERGPSPRPIPSPRPDALGRLSPDSQALEDFERERFQHKLTELIIFIRRLEVANDTLLKEKAALELKLKSPDFASERQKLLKLVEDLEQDKKRLEERCKVLNEDNFKFRGTKIPIRRQDSHSTRKSPTPETYGRLSNNSSFDNSESEQLKKQLNDHFKTITELKQQIVEKDRRLDLIQYRRQKARQRQSAILESPKGLDDEIGLDSASIASSFSQMSDNTLSGEWDEFDKAELESNYQQLSKEHLQLKKAYAQLQAMIGGSLDVQRENKLRQQLELDLLDSQAKIEDLKSIVDKQGKDSGWVEEKQKIIYDNRSLQEKITEQEDIIKKVRFDLEDSKDQNELLEFRILELEERTETLHSTTPESLLSLSPQSPGKLVKRSSLPLSSVLPEIQVAETNGHYLQIAVTEEGFTDMSVGEIKQKLEALEKDKEDDRLTSEDKKTLLGARAMLDIADLKLKKMTASESRLKRKALELEHEKDRLAAKICSLEAELRVKLSELDDSNKRVDELEDSIGKMKRTEAKFRAQEDVYLKNESKLIEDIGNLKKQMASAREGRNYENELLFQKMAEVKQEKQPETAQKVTALEKEKSKLQEKLDHLFDEHKAMASTEEDEKEPRLIELKSKMTLDELQHLKDKVGQIQAAEMKIAKMEQTELVLREHIEDLEQEVIELQQNMHDHKARYNQNIATYHERENSYKDNLRQAERSQEELREQLEMSISEESAKQKENEELKRKLTELEKSEKSLKEQIGELENDIASMHGENETDTSALRDEEADRMKVITLEASRTTLGEGSESELNKVKHENRELQDKLKVFEFSEKALKEQINQLRTENIHLQEQLKLMQNQNEKLWKSLPKNVNSDLVRTSLEKEDVLTMYREAVEEIQDLEHDGRDSTDVNMEEPSLKMSVDAVVSEDAIVKENVETVKEAPILKEMHTYILEEPIQFGNLDLGEPADQTAFEGNQKEPVFNESSGSVTMTLPESCLLSGVFVEKPIQFGSVGVQETSNLKAVEEQCSETETLNDKPIVKKTSGSATITLPKSSELLSGVVAEKPIELSRIDIQELPNMKAFEENHDNQHPKATSESESMSLPELSDLLSGVIAETSIQHGSVDLQKPADLQAIEDKPDKPIDLTLRDVEEEPHQFGKVDLQEAPNLKSLDTSPLSATKTLPRQADITESDNGLNKTKTLKRQQSLEDRIYELEASENILKQVVRDLQSNEEAWKEKNVKLNMQLSELNNKIKALEQKDKEEEQVINEMKDREIQLLEKIQEIQTEEEVQVEKERQLKEMSEKIIAAKEQNDQSNNEIKMLEESKAKLVDELNEVNSEKEEIEGKLLEARESLEEQEILLGDLRESDAKLTEHIGQLITEKDVLAEDVKDSNEKIAEQDENLTSLKTAVEQNENRIDELSVQKDELQHRLKEAYGRIEEQAIQENVLKKVIDDLQASEENMRTTVAELEESNKAFKDRMPVVAEFEKILKDTVSELEHSNETLRAKEMELDTCKSKIGETENKIEEFHAEEEALLSKVHKLENQVLQLEENEESLKKKVKSLEVDLQRREDIEVDLKEDHISEVTTLQEQIDQLEQSEKELKKKIAELSDSELNVSASHEMAHKLWKEKEGTLKNRINELEKSEDIQSGKLKELQQSESVLKEEVKKHEEVGLQTSRELYDKKKTMQDRITALEEFNKRLEDKVDELLGTEKTHKEEFEEAVKVWRQNENVLKDTVGALEEMEADLRNRLLDREQREIDLREQLDAKVRENEVSAEIWKQSEDSLNERIGKMEESEEKLLRKVEKLEQREDEMKLKVQEAEQTLKEVVESASLTYQERIQELEDIQNILKDKVSQLTEAEKNVREMLDEATLVYKQNEETLKQKVEHLEEEHGEMQGKYHELDSCKTMLMGQLEDAEKKVKDHKKGKKVLEERIIDLETEVAGLRGNLDDSQKQLVDTTRVEKEFHAQLSQQLESVQFERKANEKNLKEKVQDLLEHESELQNKVYELETATHLLEDQVGSAKVENKRLRETNDAIKEQAEELEDEGRQLRRKLKDAEEKVEDLEKTEAELRDRLKEREASEEIRQLEEKRTLDDMNKKISELQTSEEHLKDEVSFLEKSSQKLKQKIDEKNNDIGKVFEQRTKEKDDFRRKIQDLEESEIMMKEKLFELGLDMKKKEWELERIEPHVKFQTEQIQDATHQEVRHKEMTNTLRKRIEQLENRERELKSKVEDLEDFQTPLKDRASKAEKREKELQEKVEKLQKSELNLESEIVSLEKQLEMGRNKENEKLQERVMELEDSESTLKSNLAKSERSEKILQKAHKTLEEDFMYLQEEECKLREKMKQLEKDYDLIKKSKRVEIEQLASKITAMENTDKYLQKKLLDAKKSEETLQKELLTAEEAYDKTENSLRQTIKAFERNAREMEDRERELRQKVQDVEREDKNLKQKVKKLENAEESLKDELSGLENKELDLRHRVRELESSEKMLKMDNNQLKHEKDLLNEKVAELKESQKCTQKQMDDVQRNESKLKEMMQELEKHGSLMRDKITEMEANAMTLQRRSTQAAELEQELANTQEELQIANLKAEQLERAKSSLKRQLENLEDDLATGQMVSLPLDEFKRMKAQTTLLEMTEQNVEDLEKAEARLQDRLRQVEGEKDYTDADKEVLNLRCQLEEKDKELKESREKLSDAQTHLRTAQRQISELRNNHTVVRRELRDLQESLERGSIAGSVFTKRTSKATQTDALRYINSTAMQSRVYTPQNKQITLANFLETLPYSAQLPKPQSTKPTSVLSQLQWENSSSRVLISTEKEVIDVNTQPSCLSYKQSVTVEMKKTADLDRSRLIDQLVESLPVYTTPVPNIKSRLARFSHNRYSLQENNTRENIPDRTRAASRALDTAGPYERKKLIEAMAASLPDMEPKLSPGLRGVKSHSGELVEEPELAEEGVFHAELITDINVPPLPDTNPPLLSVHSHSHSESVDYFESDVPPPLPTSPIPSHLALGESDSNSESDFSDVELPPLPSSEPPSSSGHFLIKSKRQATLHMQRPPSFDSGMDSQSNGTDKDNMEVSEHSAVFVFPESSRPLTLPRTPSKEAPDVSPKPPTPLWISKLVQRQKSEKEVHEAEKDQLRAEICSLKAEKEEIEDIGELKYKLQEREEALEEKGKQCRSLRTENTQLHTEFRDKNSQITSLKAEVMRLERLLKMNKTDEAIVNELREELDKIHRQLSLKEDEVKSSVDMATMYRTKLDRRDKELAAKEGAVEEKMGEIQKLRQEMGRLEQQNRLQQSAAESKYKDLVAKLESVKRELMGKCNELENTMQEIARLEEELNELRNKLKDLDNIQSERDMLQGKLQAAEMALKNKAEQEIRLLDQLTMLQMKVEDCEKLKETRDGIEDSYRDIKLRFDDMEHKKQEALLAVAPLKAKVSRLVKKCKERDIVINRLAKELTQQYGGRSSELLDAVVRLQSRMQDEEYNEPMTPYSTSLPGIHGEPELTVERPEVSVESSLRSSPMGEASRQTPNLSENVINELSEPLWQAIERTSPGLGRSPAPSNQEITSDEAAMEVLLQSLGSNGAAAGDSTTHAASSDRTSPRNALEDLLATDPELARMLERGTSGRHSSHSDRDNLLQGIGSIETTRERRTTPRRQRVKDIPHLSQSPEEILRMHDVLQECRPEHKLLNYEPSPLLAEEQLNNIPSPYPNGLPLTSSSTPSFPPSPLTFPGASPSRLTPGSLSSISPVHYGTFPSGVARLSNGTLPLLQNWGVLPAYQRSVDTPDMASYSVGSTSSTVSPANSGMHPLAMLPPSSLQLEGPPQPPTDFRISRIVTSRSILLAWIPPAMDEMAKSNGAQVAGYKIYLNNRQKQLVNSAHLTKALIENIHVRSPMTFSIETVTVTGQTSHRAEAYFPGSVSSPTLSESMLSDSAADTEVSSILSDVTEPRKRTFIAIYSYNPAEHSPNDYPAFELVFKEGDIITVYGSMRSDGFFHGKLRGKKGLVPSNFVEEIHVSGSKGLRKKKSNSIQNGSSTPSDISRQKTGRNSRPSSGKVSWSGARV